MLKIATFLALCLFLLSCTTKPRVSGSVYGTSGSGGGGSGSIFLSHPF